MNWNYKRLSDSEVTKSDLSDGYDDPTKEGVRGACSLPFCLCCFQMQD